MYTIKQIASLLNAASKITDCNSVIEQLLTDSRRLIFAETTLFFALVTQRRDAHNFITDLYGRGVRNFVVHKNFDAAGYADGNFIFVDNMLTALQQVAAYHRKQFTYPATASVKKG